MRLRPVQGIGAVGRGTDRTALFAPGLPEMRALAGTETATGADQEIVVTLLRSVGWLSRFDLRSRTTGAGPMLATPEAQCQGPQSLRRRCVAHGWVPCCRNRSWRECVSSVNGVVQLLKFEFAYASRDVWPSRKFLRGGEPMT